ncbi:MAG: rhodanese-like domain-containing protein [bacterium]|nr:rhodanese-like domain-containing protein [bacterium]MDO8742508.1 rhodanese-like domain-containing protein [bacterium]
MTMIEAVQSGIAQLLDVRTPEEWNEGHAEHAVLIPVDKLIAGAIGSLLPDQKIYVYCKGGVRAGTATMYLRSKGFQAENVGGLTDWVCAGGSLSKT